MDDPPTPSDYELYRGKCKQLAEQACAADPSLTLTRGHYYDPLWGEQAHWWCVRPDGSILDPSARQFPSKGAGTYVPFNGFFVCEHCGRRIHEDKATTYGHHVYCSDRCLVADVL